MGRFVLNVIEYLGGVIMFIFLTALVVFVAIFISVFDKIIERYAPNSSFSKISDDIEKVLLSDD